MNQPTQPPPVSLFLMAQPPPVWYCSQVVLMGEA